jgi:hypothetical protein
MVFLGTDFWHPGAFDPMHFATGTHPKPVFPLIEKIARDAGHAFSDALLLSDDTEAILAFLRKWAAASGAGSNHAEVRLARR